jgi:hypothetical protein
MTVNEGALLHTPCEWFLVGLQYFYFKIVCEYFFLGSASTVTYEMFEEGGIFPYMFGFTIKLSNMLLQSALHVFSRFTKISG